MAKKILVGDDQWGADSKEGERLRWSFEIDYRDVLEDAEIDWTDDPDRFVSMASTGAYDTLLIDLHWSDKDFSRSYKTGFRVLDYVEDYAPKRVLWTSERKEDRERGYRHGATHCIAKGMMPHTMRELVYGD